MSTYTAQYTRPYTEGYKDRPDESTPEYARFINARDDALLRIEAFLAALNIPSKLSELVNDEGFVKNTVSNLANYYLKSETYTRTETYTQSEVQALITDAVSKVSGKLNISVVDALPTSDISTTTFYLVPKETTQEKNLYDEYINTNGTASGWELIGAVSTSVDLSEYYKKAEVDTLLANKVNTSDLVASSFSGTKAVIGNQVSGGGTYVVSDLDYSTEEQLTGKRWIDGKPIYQKSFEFETGDGTQSRTIYEDKNSFLVDINSNMNNTTEAPYFKYIETDNADGIRISFHQSNQYSNKKYNVNILYTKTTDTASSPVAPPKVEAMHVYSTEEQVVGTWIDGKPLYEKTIVYEGALKTNTTIYQDESINEVIEVSNKYFYDTLFNKWNTEISGGYQVNIMARGCDIQGDVAEVYGDRITKCRCTIQYTKTTDTATT